jgi:hypothetical protein
MYSLSLPGEKAKTMRTIFSTWEAHAYIIMVHGRGNLVDAALVTERRNPCAAAARVATAVGCEKKQRGWKTISGLARCRSDQR